MVLSGERLLAERNKRTDHGGCQPLPATEALELNHEEDRQHFRVELLQEMQRRLGSAAGCKEVIDKDHRFAGQDAVTVDLKLGAAVFELVGVREGRGGELTFLAYRNEADA